MNNVHKFDIGGERVVFNQEMNGVQIDVASPVVGVNSGRLDLRDRLVICAYAAE